MTSDQELAALGARVERARVARGLSKEAAAREAGISSITWKRVEDGLVVQDAKLELILRVVGLADEPRPTTQTTFEDLKNPKYDARQMEARIDELEQAVDELRAQLGTLELVLPRIEASLEGSYTPPARERTDEAAATLEGVSELRKTTDVADSSTSHWESERQAARKGQSVGRQLRTEQDAAGEDSQDVDAHDPA